MMIPVSLPTRKEQMPMYSRWIRFFVLATMLTAALLTGTAQADAPPRSYHLGFTPWPYDLSFEAVDYTYARITTDADLIAHHLDDGVPWSEALAGDPYPSALTDDWQGRVERTPPGHKVYLAITPLNTERHGMAGFRGDDANMPLTAPWDRYDFDHPDVKAAYVNFLVDAVEFFDPDYLCFGIEVNLLIEANPAKWDALVELLRHTYAEMKARYPDLPVFVSLTAPDLLEGWTEVDHARQMQAVEDVLPYSDYYGLSLYPYMSAYMTTQIPPTMYADLLALSNKPVVIAETGYPAQTFSIMDGTLTFESDADRQHTFITGLLEAADQYEFEFIVWYTIRDYDQLWEYFNTSMPDLSDLAAIWRDTGLYDENGEPRPALGAWLTALARPHAVARH
jgi:hypothetical protein